VISQPWDKLVEAELVGFVEAGDEIPSLLGVGRETRAVDGKKGIRGGEGRALVAVGEGMVLPMDLRRALPECGGFLDQAGVITGLRPVEGGFQQPRVSDAMGAPVAFDQVGMHGQRHRMARATVR